MRGDKKQVELRELQEGITTDDDEAGNASRDWAMPFRLCDGFGI